MDSQTAKAICDRLEADMRAWAERNLAAFDVVAQSWKAAVLHAWQEVEPAVRALGKVLDALQ